MSNNLGSKENEEILIEKPIDAEKVEKILEKKFGPFQLYIFILTCLASITPGAAVVVWGFLGEILPHR